MHHKVISEAVASTPWQNQTSTRYSLEINASFGFSAHLRSAMLPIRARPLTNAKDRGNLERPLTSPKQRFKVRSLTEVPSAHKPWKSGRKLFFKGTGGPLERRLHKSWNRKVVASSLVSAEPEEVTAHRAVKDLKVTRRNRPTSPLCRILLRNFWPCLIYSQNEYAEE